MFVQDFIYILIWWFILLALTVVNYPLTSLLLSRFIDRGYIFAKILGILLLSYIVYLLGILHLAPFSFVTTLVVLLVLALINMVIFLQIKSELRITNYELRIFLLEEFLFFSILLFWSYVRAHQPAIEGLEKFMDYGFVQSILNSNYFPPQDMWLAPAELSTVVDPNRQMYSGFFINYYYFGHLVNAVLTRLSTIPPAITYNLQIATLAALTFVGSFSIGINLFALNFEPRNFNAGKKLLLAGFLTAFLVTFSGNLHTFYTLFTPYPTTENSTPLPFWQLEFRPSSFPNSYWYPNATRFIPLTIHEFPSYSFIVSDLHGHVSNIPFVLLIIAVLYNLLITNRDRFTSKQSRNSKLVMRPPATPLSGVALRAGNSATNLKDTRLHYKQSLRTLITNYQLLITGSQLTLIGFLLAVFYMTNSWDTLVYGLLTLGILIAISNIKYRISNINLYKKLAFSLTIVGLTFFFFSLPFTYFFHPFSSKIGVNCGYQALEAFNLIGNDTTTTPATRPPLEVGPFIFEPDKCQKTPLWMHFVLWGFLYYSAIGFIIFITLPQLKRKNITASPPTNSLFRITNYKLQITNTDKFLIFLIAISVFLLWFPELFYIKDIYPAHFRANTMFKLGYQAFIMLSLVSGYTVVKVISMLKRSFPFTHSPIHLIYLLFLFPQLLLVIIYPYFGINSYYNALLKYEGLYGLNWFSDRYPEDYQAVIWLQAYLKNDSQNPLAQKGSTLSRTTLSNSAYSGRTLGETTVRPENTQRPPVILEAVGESYTAYARVSANSGLTTIIGWPVHEWLWRGSYDEAGYRRTEVETIYTSKDLATVKNLLAKYEVKYIFVGTLEREKYPNLTEEVFHQLGTVIYQNSGSKIYQL